MRRKWESTGQARSTLDSILMHRYPRQLACVATAFVAIGGCSPAPFERVACTEDAQCAAAFPDNVASCSVESGVCDVLDPGACNVNADCRAQPELGVGFTCNAGACDPLEPNPRCSQTYPSGLLDPGNFSDVVIFGSIVERGYDGDAVLENAARLAIDQANEADGLDGSKLGIVLCDMSEDGALDDLTLDEAAVASAQWLQATLGAPAIHGPTTSGTTELVFEALRTTDTLLLSPSATSPDLTLLDSANPSDDQPGLLWRTVPPDSVQGQTIADDMLARDIQNVVVVAESGSYGVGLQNYFVDVYRAQGGTVAGELLQFDGSSERDAALVTAAALIGNGDAQEVLFISGEISDSIEFLNFASTSDAFAGGAGIFLTDTSKTADIFDQTRPEVAAILPRVRLTAPAPGQGAVYDTFAGAYSARFPENPRDFGFLPQAYDAVWLMIYGAAWAHYHESDAPITGSAIGRGLRRMSEGIEVDITGASWRSIRSAIEAGEGLDVQGASGELDYDANTEELLDAQIDVVAVDTCDAPAFEIVGVGGGVVACE
jgi:ABC-type branched-subunit amino acid transport system substrate-binding protein